MKREEEEEEEEEEEHMPHSMCCISCTRITLNAECPKRVCVCGCVLVCWLPSLI